MEARRAHNPEVVGSSPASATKKVLKSRDFRTFSFVSMPKSWTKFSRNPTDPYRDPYYDSSQWTRQHQRLFSGYQVPGNRKIIGNLSVKFSALKLCKSNNIALDTVIGQLPGRFCFFCFVSYCVAIENTTVWRGYVILSFRKTRADFLNQNACYGIVSSDNEGRRPYEDIACRRRYRLAWCIGRAS